MYLNISLLICFHHETPFDDFKQTFKSVFAQQYIPNEILLIQNGPVKKKFENFISDQSKSKFIQHIIISNNSGLALALNKGINKSKNNFVARLDPGDLIINERFYLQYQFMKKNKHISICGSYAIESNEKKDFLLKKPILDKDIRHRIRLQNPIIHSSVLFKKKDIELIGGYPNIFKCQDYFLWVKCFENEYKFHNLPQPLIKIVLDKKMMKRRDIEYFKYEKKIYLYMYKKKIIHLFNYYFLIFYRFILRNLPVSLKYYLYYILRS